MHKDKFIDPNTYDYVQFDDEYTKCKICQNYHEVSSISKINFNECLHDELIGEEIPIPTGRGNKERWQKIVKETHKCPFCPKHNKENEGRKQRTDRYKVKRKGK